MSARMHLEDAAAVPAPREAKAGQSGGAMSTNNRPQNAGASMNDDTPRVDAVAKVTGRAKYGRDMYLDNQLFVSFVRCPWGAASLVSTDVEAAKAVPGIVEVNITGDRGRYHGHQVGYIVGESKHAVRRAMRALDAKWQRGEVKTGIPADVQAELTAKTEGADHVLEAVYSTPVQTHSALETHGVVVEHNGQGAIVHASTQGTFSVRDGLSQALNLPDSMIEVRCEYVGGGFGAKFGPGKEGMVAAQVAARHKRPVSLFLDRDEEHLDTGNRPSLRAAVKVGFKKDGSIVGGHIHKWGGVGVAQRGGGAAVPSGRYSLGEVTDSDEDVSFNAGGPAAMRAPGFPQGAFVEELMVDEIATMAGIDPLELRMRLDGAEDRREMYRRGAEMIGWGDRKATGSQSDPVRVGFGMGSTDWHTGRGRAEAEVVIHRDGSVEARTGTQDIGTGQRTIMGIAVAQHLGVPLERIDVRIGSSNLPVGPASGGSVTATNSVPPMMAAAADAKAKFLKSIADRAGAAVAEFDIVNGEITRNGQKFATWTDACQRMDAETITGKGNSSARERFGGQGHSQGVQFVRLEVDAETGVIAVKHVVAFQSCGQVMCRKTTESQIIGGVIQGLSYALFENRILDRVTGAMVNPDLEMYKILGPADMPHIEPVLWTKGQTGVRPIGEPPVVPTAGATACAVYNAIGIPVRHLPITPDKVLAAIEAAGGGRAS